MHPTGASTIFRPAVPNMPVAALMLIENSRNMKLIWPQLRDQHLPTLIGALRVANPIAPIKILMLTSMPVDESTSQANGPREYNELPELHFDLRPDNKISAAVITHAVELLAAAGSGENTARHIIIVAASAPTDEPVFRQSSDPGYDVSITGSAWDSIPQRLAYYDIQCHMVLPSYNRDMRAYSQLFHETLRLQQFEEVAHTGGPFIFHLSARPIRETLNYAGGAGCHVPRNSAIEQPSFHHDFSLPPDVYTANALSPPTSPATMGPPDSEVDSMTPSLVARLQQAHGLTKKKIYGAKPVRQPFFREDRVREKYRQAPTPLTIPAAMPDTSAGSLVHRDGRAKLDRKSLAEKGLPVSPVEPHSISRRRSSWSRRGSTVSSSETETSLSSPTSSTYDAIPPTLPIHRGSEFMSTIRPMPPMTTPADMYASDAMMRSAGMGATGYVDPVMNTTWPPGQNITGPPHSPPLNPPDSGLYGGGMVTSDRVATPKVHHTLPPRHFTSYQSSPPVLHAGQPRPSSSKPFPGLEEDQAYLSLLQTPVDGDAPFIFGDEFDDRPIAPAHEYPRPLPNTHYAGPSANNRPYTVSSAVMSPSQNRSSPAQSYLPPSPTPADVSYTRNMNRRSAQHSPESRWPMSGSQINSGSSSLTGWAG